MNTKEKLYNSINTVTDESGEKVIAKMLATMITTKSKNNYK
nr:hypothetical protein [Clostridioides sp.]